MSEQATLLVISTLGSVVVTFLTVRYKYRVVQKPTAPKDRMETIFDGYEKLIKQQQQEIDRKGQTVAQLDSIVHRLEQELQETKELLEHARAELEQAKEQNKLLNNQLAAMKIEYANTAVQDVL